MLRRRVINKNSDKVSLTRLTNNSTITKIWLRLFTVRCFCAMLQLNNKLRESSSKEKLRSIKRSTHSGKSLRSKRWLSMMRDLEKSSRKNTTKR